MRVCAQAWRIHAREPLGSTTTARLRTRATSPLVPARWKGGATKPKDEGAMPAASLHAACANCGSRYVQKPAIGEVAASELPTKAAAPATL